MQEDKDLDGIAPFGNHSYNGAMPDQTRKIVLSCLTLFLSACLCLSALGLIWLGLIIF